ncbi:ATP-binding cassette domain-containing protein [Actinopolymorpha sp. B11F2]|uniref:ABC transporter ATP-binding protein n=1 Tax=Actinopolymorpha sp. B11F2 TaxID=3160862 RepID=UPI0032E51621
MFSVKGQQTLRRRIHLPPAVLGIIAVLRLLPQVGRGRTVLFAVGVALSSVLPIALAVLTGLVVGSIPAAVRGGLDSPAGTTTVRLLVALAVIVVVLRVCQPVLAALTATLGRGLDRLLQEKVITAVGRPHGIAHLEDPDVLADVRKVRGLGMDPTRPSMAIEALGWLLPSWLQALGSTVVLAFFHWWLGLIWLVAWPVLVYVMQREYVRVGQITYGQSSALRRAEYLRDLALEPPAGKEVRVWGMLDWLISRFESTWRTAIEPVWNARKPHPRTLFGSTGAVLVLNLASYGLLAWAATRGDLALGALAVYAQALNGANAYAAFNDGNAHLSFAAVVVPRLLELDERLRTDAPAAARAIAGPAGDRDFPARDVRFEGVTFQYPRSERRALAGLTLTLAAHRSLAIVGENGAGKTSLVKLLCGLYAPTSGRISVDGTDLRDLDPAAWRSQVAVLFQDFARYHLPVRDNIGMGAPELAGDLDRLRSAARRAGLLDVIEGLPLGWDTVLSREYTGGTDLSGGQWQRVALARAMFAVEAGARVLILDEPTAALDVRAEAELYDRFLELTEGLTTILISHRFSTVRRADRIVVLADGAIDEDGTHEQLMAQGGRYAHMFTLQAARFTDELAVAGEGGRDA